MNFLSENANFADILDADVICNSQPISLPSSQSTDSVDVCEGAHIFNNLECMRPPKFTGQQGVFRSTEEIDPKYRSIFTYPYFNLVQSRVMEDALYSDKSMVVCAPTGSGKTVVFEMAIVQLLMDIEDNNYKEDFKIIYMAPVKALCTERLTEWYPKFTKLGLLCIEVTGDTDVEFPQLKPYRIIITTPEKWDMLTRRWKDYRGLVEVIKLFLIDEVHILNDSSRGPVLEAVVSRMKTIESSAQSAHRIEQLQKQYGGNQSKEDTYTRSPRIRFVAVSATVNNPEDVATWLGAADKPAVYYKFGDECRPVKLVRVVEGYPCSQGTSIFKFDIILNYKLWPIIQKYHNGKPTLIFCNTRKSVALTAEALSREITINFNPDQKRKLMVLASTLKNKKLQALILNGVGCHHAGLLFEERLNIENAFRNRDLPILITTTTLAMGVNLPAHLVIIKNTQQYVNGAYQEYSISTILQMVGRAGRPQFDNEATAVIMTRMVDKARYQALVEGTEPLQSFLHKRIAENLNSEAALGTVTDVAQCVQWVNSTFLSVRAAKDPRRYLGLPQAAPANEISKKIEELCVKAMNGLASSGLITMDEASCIESTEAGKLMSMYYIDLDTMKLIMKIEGSETLDRLLWLICESHELSDMHLRVDERRCLNALNRSNTAATIRFPMKGKISSRQMKLNCVIQAVLGCLTIPDPSLNQEAMKIMRIALRVCKCLVSYTTRPTSVSQQPKTFSSVLNSIVLTKCLAAHLWENSPYVSKQLKGIGPAFSMLLASAGKTNFVLLEESHPRDLERIMNKGPPAGNVIRKQISLLPKYQLAITPIDRHRIQIQLTLLNQAHLSENLENLTAGVNHRSYIIVGDSENYLLYITCFKDTDLIKIYDGCITCEVTRKHNHEHKVMAHCISSSCAGIDVQTEHLFIEIGYVYAKSTDNDTNKYKDVPNLINIPKQKPVDRKRKVNTNVGVASSKEKVKRNITLQDNFKYLKDSSAKTCKEMTGNINKNTEMMNMIPQNFTQPKCNINNECFEPIVIEDIGIKENLEIVTIDNSLNKEDQFENLEDNQVNNILSRIENEMNEKLTTPQCIQKQEKSLLSFNNNNSDMVMHKRYANKTRVSYKRNDNFNIIHVLEKELDISEEKDVIFNNDNIQGFTNTVKCKIDKYLESAENTKCIKYKDIDNVLEIQNEGVINVKNHSKFPIGKVADGHFINVSQVHKDKSGIRNESSIVDSNPKVLHHTAQQLIKSVCVKDKNNNCENMMDCNKRSESDRESILFEFSKDNTNINTTQPPYSSLVNDDVKDVNYLNQNNNNLTKNIDILHPQNNDNYKELHTTILQINIPEPKTVVNVIHDTMNEKEDISDSNFAHETNNLRFTIPPGSVAKTSSNLESNTSSFNHAKSSETSIGIEVEEIVPNLDNQIILHKKNENDFSVARSTSDENGKLKECHESRVVDSYKPCLIYSTDFQSSPTIDQYSINKNCYPYYTSNEMTIDGTPKDNDEDTPRIEKYCFRTTEFNICSDNNSKRTIKIISKLKVELDITKIVSTKEERTRICEAAIEDTENDANDTKKVELEVNTLDMDIDVSPSPTSKVDLKNSIDIINNNLNLLDYTKEIKESAFKSLVPELQEPTPNQFNKNHFKVEDILKKYSFLMRKPNSIVVPEIKQTKNDRITNQPSDKAKRRYKINDILNTHAPVPTELIGNDLNFGHFNKVNGKDEVKGSQDYLSDHLRPSEMCIDVPELNLSVPLSTQISCVKNDSKMNEVLSPDRKTCEVANTPFNLNKAILNPKTLLECYTDNGDTEVIPPPPEFSDLTDLDTHINPPNDYTPASPNYKPEMYSYDILNNNSHCETKGGGYSFKEISHDEAGLTPSKEIETWTFPPEDNQQDHIKPILVQNQVNYKTIRNYSSNNGNIFSYNRSVKLSEFKHRRKNILKLKK